MKETGLTGKRRSTTIAATPDDGNSQRKRRRRIEHGLLIGQYIPSVCCWSMASVDSVDKVCCGMVSSTVSQTVVHLLGDITYLWPVVFLFTH